VSSRNSTAENADDADLDFDLRHPCHLRLKLFAGYLGTSEPIDCRGLVSKDHDLILYTRGEQNTELASHFKQLIAIAEQSHLAVDKFFSCRLEDDRDSIEVAHIEVGNFQTAIVEKNAETGVPFRINKKIGQKLRLIVQRKFVPLFCSNETSSFIEFDFPLHRC